ncbi:hypothetical protein Hanom_Chr08g00739211 [Helianthus anomalus]
MKSVVDYFREVYRFTIQHPRLHAHGGLQDCRGTKAHKGTEQ